MKVNICQVGEEKPDQIDVRLETTDCGGVKLMGRKTGASRWETLLVFFPDTVCTSFNLYRKTLSSLRLSDKPAVINFG